MIHSQTSSQGSQKQHRRGRPRVISRGRKPYTARERARQAVIRCRNKKKQELLQAKEAVQAYKEELKQINKTAAKLKCEMKTIRKICDNEALNVDNIEHIDLSHFLPPPGLDVDGDNGDGDAS